MAEQARRYEADVAWLVARNDRFVGSPCPVCSESRATPTWKKSGLTYVECAGCQTVYMRPRPSPELLSEYYSSSQNYEYWNNVVFPASEAARRAKIFRPRAERVAEISERYGNPGGTLLDVGAGYGTFCEEVVALGGFARVIALEPEPQLAETCRSKGLEVVEAPVEQAELDPADVITSFEVIEHLFSPRDLIQRCAGLLQPGGLLVLTCPNVRGFDIVVMREGASAVDAEHLNYMHPGSLGKLLDDVGFDVVESSTPGRLDAELVRKRVLAGDFDLTRQPFLQQVLIDEWDRLGSAFQDFLASNELSSNMWLVGRRR